MTSAPTFDVAVIGLGAMGSATAYHLARRGLRVIGFDRYRPPHTIGSTHGESRIIREAYYEDPRYVPLVQRAYELWAELERETDQTLFRRTGGLMLGAPESRVVSGARASAELHGLPHEMLSAADVRRRFPALRPPDDLVGLFEERAGILAVEACLEAHLSLAARHGAELHFDEPVSRWEPQGDGAEPVTLVTASGRYTAGAVVLAAGAWTQSLLAKLNLPLRVTRQSFFWFAPLRNATAFLPERCPVWVWEHTPGDYSYGFPDLGTGVKLGHHTTVEDADAETIDRTIQPRDEEHIRGVVARQIPDANGRLLSAYVCMYTNTPDAHFLIDRHPRRRNVLIASPCSGHGFKFSSVIGEVLADLVGGDDPGYDIDLFRIDRLLAGQDAG